MKFFNKIKGNIGEEKAMLFLKKKKYKILDRNYRNKIGEIDIIASLKKIIVFVEVKTRSSLQYGTPAEAVNYFKQKKIREVAQCYLQAKKFEDREIRFDVIEVLDDEITHLENAF